MSLLTWIKEKIKMLFKTDIEKVFGVRTYLSPEMENSIRLWEQLEGAHNLTPPWVKGKVETIKFSNTIADELAKLITQNIDIKVQGIRPGAMPEQMQKIMDEYVLQKSNDFMCDVVKFGGVMAKWDGEGIQFLRPDMFLVTEYNSNGEILGVIFFSYHAEGKKYYTRAEWHRFENKTLKDAETGENTTVRVYRVSNKAFKSDNKDEIGREIPLSQTVWADIEPEVSADNIEKPMFCYIKCPTFNTIDPDSPLGVPCFVNCITEFKALDTAWSTMQTENRNSAPMLMVDQSVIQYATMNGIELPEFISNTGLGLSDGDKPVEEWQPTLQIASRKEAINFYLNIISVKTGFSQGYFSFNEHQGLVTATQVEADERNTINTMMNYRNILDRPKSNGDGRTGAIHDIAYIINVMLVSNGEVALSEYGNYELFCNFGDPFENKQEDMMLDLQLANQGYISKAAFLVLHRGYTEEKARKMVEDARKESESGRGDGLFDEE